MVRRAIHQLLSPSLACKEAVYEELLRIAEQACPKEAARYVYVQGRSCYTRLQARTEAVYKELLRIAEAAR